MGPVVQNVLYRGGEQVVVGVVMRRILAALAALLLLLLTACSSPAGNGVSATGGPDASVGASVSGASVTAEAPEAPPSPEEVMSVLGCEGTLNTKAEPQKGRIAIYMCQGSGDSTLDNVRFFESHGYVQASLEDLRKNVPSALTKHTTIVGDTWLVITDMSDRIAAAVDYGGEIVHP